MVMAALLRILLFTTLTVLGVSFAAAQGSNEPASEPPADTSVNLSSEVPALFSVGVSGGFPSYQTVALSVSLQSSFVGLQAKGSWTAVGPFVGLQLRGYPPVPFPVPLYLGVGVGIYGSNVSYHAAVGGHVPLGRTLRFDVEAGVASVPLLASRSLAPHVALGLSYAVPIEVDVDAREDNEEFGRSVSERSSGPVMPACAQPVAPDSGALDDALERLVDEWIASARATYGSVYSDLNYSYSVTSSSISGTSAKVSVSYSGSVREIATGTRHETSGTAAAEFEWTGCSWVSRGVTY